MVPSGETTDALTDFSDMLPTFAELGGVKLPQELILDGKSIAPLLLGKSDDSPRDWIMAFGHGAAKVDDKGVRGVHDYVDRVIRDKQFTVWVDPTKQISALCDLLADPLEKKNLIDSKKLANVTAIKKFQEVIDATPDQDARPMYRPRNPNPWDQKPRPVEAEPKKAKAKPKANEAKSKKENKKKTAKSSGSDDGVCEAAETDLQWEIDTQEEWEESATDTSGLAIANGVVAPIEKTSTFKIRLKRFDEKRSATSIFLEQSTI